MSFRPESMGGTPNVQQVAGQIDYRLARNVIISEFRKGRLSRLDVCDAQSELMRAALHCGQPSPEKCPICQDSNVVLLSYVFGSRLPPSGRLVVSGAELGKLSRPGRELVCYVVEVCPACAWNHMVRTFVVSERGTERS